MDEVIPREGIFLNEKTGEVDNWNGNGIQETSENSKNDENNDSLNSDKKENCAGISSVNDNKEVIINNDLEITRESNENDHKYDGPSAESIEILMQQITKLEEKINTENKEKNCVEESCNETVNSTQEIELNPSVQNEAQEEAPSITNNEEKTENASTSQETEKCDKSTESQDSIEETETDKSKADDEFNDDDDFDPSLLCPEVSMDVDESSSINPTTSNNDNASTSTPSESICSTFIDVMTGAEVNFDITVEEQELRGRLFGENNPVEFTKIHCTACNVHLGSALEGQGNRFVHPLLKVIICKDCYHFYTSGEFEKDEDGSELYCRWCGQGGQVVCCSKCEFVFCNRCIRNNFGRKKVAEIKNSDNWLCFRCNQSQLCALRIACYEFFEYIKRQMSKTSTDDTKWSTDYCRCCSGKKRDIEDSEHNSRSRKKRRVNDPDYNPVVEDEEEEQEKEQDELPSLAPLTVPKPLITIAKPAETIMSNFVLNPISTIPAGMGFRAIIPSNISQLGIPITFSSDNTSVPPLLPTMKFKKTFDSGKKHEWFNKTVRASTRVNSQLTVTLNQLNQAQSRATTVEELAVIHNKLQEVLSSSINSLIQIRRNLRTEFITGIKAVRVTPKPPEQPTPNIDDDVILVSAPDSMPIPSTSQPIILKKQLVRKLPAPSLSLLKPPVGGFIKVKPISDLQSVSPECITIPDDEPVESTSKRPTIKVRSPSTLKSIESLQSIINKCITANANSNIENTPGNSKPIFKKSAKHVLKTALPTKAVMKNIEQKNVKPIDRKNKEQEAKVNETNSCKDVTNIRYDIKEKPSKTIKKMLSVTVRLEKMDTRLESKMLNGYSKV